MSADEPEPSPVASEEKLAALLAMLVDERRQGRWPDLDDLARQHPDLAVELRSLWATAQVAEELFRPPVSEALSRSGSSRYHDPEPLPTRIGDCELLGELGRGGMGVVYRARQAGLGRLVALKVLQRGPSASPADLARFRVEATAAARLDHPNIVPVHAVGEHEGQPYLLMKLIEGPTLAQRLADGPLPPRLAAALLAPISRAVDEAHRHGVLHRDLKPSNILIAADGRPLVADFGLAKQTDADLSLSQSGAILGTPGYMAPEQVAGGRGIIGPSCDVYGLGAILYQMLTGRAPLQAASPLDTLMLVLEQDPLPPRLLNPKADRDLELIALKCLQKPPDLRYPTAAALADDLEAYLAGMPISARSGRLATVATRFLRETHHAPILENWGLLWIWHSLVLLVLCCLTNGLQWRGVRSSWPYLLIWIVGLGAWAATFWGLRRRAGPVTFVERQIAHLWAGSMIACTGLFGVEALLGLPVLALSPVLPLFSGMVFLGKAGILSGAFYAQAVALFLTAIPMAVWPGVGLSLYGLISAACFFVPGWKYHRQRDRLGRYAPRA